MKLIHGNGNLMDYKSALIDLLRASWNYLDAVDGVGLVGRARTVLDQEIEKAQLLLAQTVESQIDKLPNTNGYPKQVIVVRNDLNMRKGKMIAQGAHASMKFLLKNMLFGLKDPNGNYADPSYLRHKEAFDAWLTGKFTKIAVSVDSEDELMDIYNKATYVMLPVALVEDVGLTEFKGVVTKTAIGIGPAWAHDIDPITRHLKLL